MERVSAGEINRVKRAKGEEGKRDNNCAFLAFSFSPFNLFPFSPDAPHEHFKNEPECTHGRRNI
jgi:hypothetical protein